MSGNRAVRVATTGARLVTGALVAAACVAGTVAAIAAPWPVIAHEPAQAAVDPSPGDTVLVCNGDLRDLGRDTQNALQMQSAGSPRLTIGESTGAPDITALSVDDLAGAGEVRRVTGAVEGRTAPLIGATESIAVSDADLSGYAAAPCREAGIESWLVGGSVQTGARDIIVLTNPGAVPATVTLTVYGTTRSTSTTIVPAGTQVALPLASIAAGSPTPIVKVVAAGSPVRAVLQSSLTQTLDPIGIDLQDAVVAPQRRPVIPGVQLVQDEGDGSSSAVLRLFSPGADANATVTVRASGSSEVASTFTMDLAADVPTEMALSALDPGMYVVSVDADEPVLAGVREQDGAGPGSDFAWALPAPEIDGEVLTAVPDGPSPVLYLVNDEDVDAAATVVDTAGGPSKDVTVPAGSSVAVPVSERTVYSVATSGPVHASVAVSADGALAVWPVWPPIAAEKKITVYP
ncbi:MAG: hypothetical protein J7484_13665 [Microbacterium sp.]|nr:hypothetical protein [Microbacterium sp.]